MYINCCYLEQSSKPESMRYLTLTILVFTCFSCHKEVHTNLMAGHYRGILEVQDGKQLPFNFKVRNDDIIEIYNAEEIIEIDDIIYFNDSVRINFPVYEGYIVGRFSEGKIYDAKYIKESLDRIVPFHAFYDISDRFLKVKQARENATGIWEILFTEEDGSTFIAKGIFNQNGNKVTGTIRTTTGDYRYLEGVMDGSQLKLSTFDGAHAFLFTADVSNSIMQGTFYSGNHYKALFKAEINANYELPHEDTLTFLNEDYESLEFSFPDETGKLISLTDDRFKNKVVLVQIMGTWCPNCIDESKYYSEFYKSNKDKGLEIVALAFEYAKTKEKAFAGIQRLKEHVSIEYPILLAQFGTSDKAKAQEKLPMLNHVLSYPTTIFIDKKGTVRKIHTGFNGPATGEKYVSFQYEFSSFIETLLNE